ncbi:hypothetical protein EVAR_9135_1 [Eumeta japonica]|uniref:Uncharacterized protein n=1 Tax=Eumeta variegata TaxID=151549 RepID=A0A4C1TW73_EUMVA|nr:hypothetical protein EVAR_9135_1 [Eumeta japonica]
MLTHGRRRTNAPIRDKNRSSGGRARQNGGPSGRAANWRSPDGAGRQSRFDYSADNTRRNRPPVCCKNAAHDRIGRAEQASGRDEDSRRAAVAGKGHRTRRERSRMHGKRYSRRRRSMV